MNWLWNWLLGADIWLLGFGLVIVLRQFWVIMAAERGRKKDLVKRVQKPNLDFHLSVLIPYLDTRQLKSLSDLIEALDGQDYPATKVLIHIAATKDTINSLDPATLPPQVKVWTYPAYRVQTGDVLAWLIERCLAASGGGGFFIFLKPEDIVKQDFFQNIVTPGADSFALQGYVASRHAPLTPLAKVCNLSQRLINRITNAGGSHLGQTCVLQDSGWAVKREVLEMVPYHRGDDLDNLEYTLRLQLSRFNVTWAPNVVVFREETASLIGAVTRCVGSFCNRLQLIFRYGPALVMAGLGRGDFRFLESAARLLKPPTFVAGLALVLMTGLAASKNLPWLIPGRADSWTVLLASFAVLHLFSLFVARCKPGDAITTVIWTPLLYFIGLVTFPWTLLAYVCAHTLGRAFSPKQRQLEVVTRFNESLPPVQGLFGNEERYQAILEDVVADAHRQDAEAEEECADSVESEAEATAAMAANPDWPTTLPNEDNSKVPAHRHPPREKTRWVPLSHGAKQVQCKLITRTTIADNGDEVHQMILEYKTMSVATASYRILDQAFYELHAKLQGRGFTVVTCGSCGYFYNPTADVPEAIKNAGVCLYGKMGKEVNLETDSVTVVSQACAYHAAIDEREGIVRRWRDSLPAASGV